jgi:hypothetical protein
MRRDRRSDVDVSSLFLALVAALGLLLSVAMATFVP